MHPKIKEFFEGLYPGLCISAKTYMSGSILHEIPAPHMSLGWKNVLAIQKPGKETIYYHKGVETSEEEMLRLVKLKSFM